MNANQFSGLAGVFFLSMILGYSHGGKHGHSEEFFLLVPADQLRVTVVDQKDLSSDPIWDNLAISGPAGFDGGLVVSVKDEFFYSQSNGLAKKSFLTAAIGILFVIFGNLLIWIFRRRRQKREATGM